MRNITMTELCERIEQKEAALNWVDDEASTESLRNSGSRRTPAKRRQLARIEARARAAGKVPVKSYY